MSRTLGVALGLFLVVALNTAAREFHTDQFDHSPLNPSWTFFAPGGGSYDLRDGWVHFIAPGPLWILAEDEASMPPMILIEPPADDVFTFETRIRFHNVAPFASAGLVAIRKDLESRMILEYSPTVGGGMVLLTWLAGALHGGGSAQVGLTGDTWLRVELPSDMPFTEPRFFYRQGGEEDPWIDATAPGVVFPFRLPADIIKPRFLPGEYWIGLYVDGGSAKLEGDMEVKAAFDYFHSPQLQPLAVDTGNTAATLWGSLKQRRRLSE